MLELVGKMENIIQKLRKKYLFHEKTVQYVRNKE